MTGNGRGFGFVTFQDKKGAQSISILYYYEHNAAGSALFPCVCVLVCCGRIAYVVTVVWLVPPVAERVVAQKHEIRGRTVGVCRAGVGLSLSTFALRSSSPCISAAAGGGVSRNMCMYRSRDRGRVSGEEAGSFACRVPRKVSGRAGESRTCTAGRALQTKHSGEIFRGDFLEGRACRLGGRDI